MAENSRHKAREIVLQSLYAVENSDNNPDQIIDNIFAASELSKRNIDFARNLFQLVLNDKDWADLQISALVENWDIERIAAIDHLILRMAMVELEKMPDVPVKVILNEAIELAKTFSTGKSFGFINGVLDRFVKLNEERNKFS